MKDLLKLAVVLPICFNAFLWGQTAYSSDISTFTQFTNPGLYDTNTQIKDNIIFETQAVVPFYSKTVNVYGNNYTIDGNQQGYTSGFKPAENASGSGFGFNDGSKALIQNLNFTNFTHRERGTIYVNNSSVTLDNITMTGFEQTMKDGHIWGSMIAVVDTPWNSDKKTVIQNSTFQNVNLTLDVSQSAEVDSNGNPIDFDSDGGVLHIQGSQGNHGQSNAEITNSQFLNNKLSSDRNIHGGAVYNEGILTEVSGSIFEDNSVNATGTLNELQTGTEDEKMFHTGGFGGAFSLGSHHEGRGSATINVLQNTDFINNTVTSNEGFARGGALWSGDGSVIGQIIDGEFTGNGGIINCTFTGNNSISIAGKASGGAIYNNGTIEKISGSTFENNHVLSPNEFTAGEAVVMTNLTGAGGAIFSKNDITIQDGTTLSNNSIKYVKRDSADAVIDAQTIEVGNDIHLSADNSVGADLTITTSNKNDLTKNFVSVSSGIASRDSSSSITVKGGAILNLSGVNKFFTGQTNITENSILNFTQTAQYKEKGVGKYYDSFLNGTVNIETGSTLNFANGPVSDSNNQPILNSEGNPLVIDGTVQNLTGGGTFHKTGSGAVTIGDSVNPNVSFSGLIDLDGGSLTINTAPQTTKEQFDFAANIGAGTTFDFYNGGWVLGVRDDYFTLNKDSKFQFAQENSNANLNFLGHGTFTIKEDIKNATGNNISINYATVSFDSNEYNANYSIGNSTLNLQHDNTITDIVFNNKFDTIATLNMDFDFTGQGDTDTITAHDGYSVFTIGNIRGLNSANDMGQLAGEAHTYTVLNGSTFNGATKTVESDIYTYTAQTTSDGKGLTLTATGLLADTLYKLNHVKTGQNRYFYFLGNSPYNVGQSLKETLAGTLNVYGKSDNPADSVITGNNQYSFFQNNTNSTLNISDVTLQEAKGVGIASVLDVTANSTATFDNVVIKDNVTDGGLASAISNAGGTVTFNNVEFDNNTGADNYIYNSGTMTISTTENRTLTNGTSGNAISNVTNGTLNLTANNNSTYTIASVINNAGTVNTNGNIVFTNDINNTGSLNVLANSIATITNNSNIGGETNIAQSAKLNYIANQASTLEEVTGRGTINYSGNSDLTLADTGNFTGVVNANGTQLNVTSNKTDAFNINIQQGILNFTAVNNSNLNLDDKSKISFAENTTGAQAIFNGGNTYTLGNIENVNGNTVTFKDTTVKTSQTSYNVGNYVIGNNAILNLVNNGSDTNKTNIVDFGNLSSNGGKLSIDVDLKPLPNTSPKSDVLNVTNGSGALALTSMNVLDNKDDGLHSTYSFDVINGRNDLTLDRDKSITKWATNVYEYDVDVNNAGKGIIMSAVKASDENSLKAMNIYEGTRGFQFRADDTKTQYEIGSDLGTTANGIFTVMGTEDGKTVISGGNEHSFFDVQNETDLTINNVTITEAETNVNGSVINANNNNATIHLENVDVKNNSAESGNGGAIANLSSESFVIENMKADNNTAGGLGGAIYTASNMTITDSDFGTTGLNYHKTAQNQEQNDIYIAGENTEVDYFVSEGKTTTINSGLAGDGKFIKTGEGTLNLNGKNDGLTGLFAVDDGKVLYTKDETTDTFAQGDVRVNGELQLAIADTLQETIQNVSGNGILTKTGTGTLNLNGNNSGFTGTANINVGTVTYTATNATDSYINGKTNIAKGATFNAINSSINGGLAGEGTFNANNSTLSGKNDKFTGTLNVTNGLTFSQTYATDTYIAGTTNVGTSSVILNIDKGDTTTGNFTGSGTLTKNGSKDAVITGDNSGFTGDVNINEGSISYNADNTKYFGGNTKLTQNGTLKVSTNNGTELSNISGSGTLSKDGTGTLTIVGDNSEFNGNLNINKGVFALGADSSVGQIAKGVFADNTAINLQNTTAVLDENGNWTTNPNPASIENLKFDKLTLNGNVGLNIDVDLKNTIADTVEATTVDGNGHLILGSNSLNVVSDSLLKNTKVQIASGALANGDRILLSDDAKTVMGPIQKYNVTYANGNLGFSRQGGANPSINSVNPSVMASVVATQVGGYLTQLQTLQDGFYHMDRYSKYSSAMRLTAEMNNRNAIVDTPVYHKSPLPETSQAMWVKPYTSFESIDLKGGVDVSTITYGTLYGGDTNLVDLGHGFKGVLSTFIGYNGSQQSYNGISMSQNGGTLGVTGTLYKGNFFTGLTASTGASAGEAYTHYGQDNFAMLTAGIANKTGYNWEIKEGKLIVQPSLFLGYTFVNTFDYTNSAGIKIDSDPLHAIQVVPGIKIIGNLKNGWQPYAGVDMVWNIIDKTNVLANDVRLPQLSVKPYVQYGVGVQKSWGDRFTAFFQTMIRNGGRNGVMLSAGFRWSIGKDQRNTHSPNVPKKKKVIKQIEHI